MLCFFGDAGNPFRVYYAGPSRTRTSGGPERPYLVFIWGTDVEVVAHISRSVCMRYVFLLFFRVFCPSFAPWKLSSKSICSFVFWILAVVLSSIVRLSPAFTQGLVPSDLERICALALTAPGYSSRHRLDET